MRRHVPELRPFVARHSQGSRAEKGEFLVNIVGPKGSLGEADGDVLM
jgi:hypothetical protein